MMHAFYRNVNNHMINWSHIYVVAIVLLAQLYFLHWWACTWLTDVSPTRRPYATHMIDTLQYYTRSSTCLHRQTDRQTGRHTHTNTHHSLSHSQMFPSCLHLSLTFINKQKSKLHYLQTTLSTTLPGRVSRLSVGRPAQVSSLMGVMVHVWVHWPLHSPTLLRIRVSIMHFSSPFSCKSTQSWLILVPSWSGYCACSCCGCVWASVYFASPNLIASAQPWTPGSNNLNRFFFLLLIVCLFVFFKFTVLSNFSVLKLKPLEIFVHTAAQVHRLPSHSSFSFTFME